MFNWFVAGIVWIGFKVGLGVGNSVVEKEETFIVIFLKAFVN